MFRAIFPRGRKTSDFGAEIEAHIQLETERLQEQGLSQEDARAAAHRAFGNTTHAQERFYESSRWPWWDHFWQDIRYALRMPRKSPGFTVIAILTIALGIGATTAAFSVINATLLQPLPYPEPHQLVSVVDDLPGVGATDVGINRPEYQDLQHSGIFQYVSPVWYDENNLTGASQPCTVRLVSVAPDYFALLGIEPELGRTFDPEYDKPGFTTEAVISDGLWTRLFARDPSILYKSIRMDTDLYHIIGVMPPGFHAPGRTTADRNIEVWVATSFYGPPLLDNPPRNRRNIPGAIARIKPGLTVEQAQSQVDSLVAALQKQFPGDYPAQSAWRVRLVPLRDTVIGSVRQPLILLLGAVGLVLLIGCVNVANLLLARGSTRGREMAIRQALGASRRRLVSQLLTESLLLAVVGGTFGLATLFLMRTILLRLLPASLPRLNEISIDWRVLLFALGCSLIAGVIFGLAPAWHAGRLDLTHALKQEGRGLTGVGQRGRTRRALVVTEFALSVVLLIAAGLLLRSFWDLLNAQLGFDPENAMSIRTRLPYPNDTSIDKYATAATEAPFLRELDRRFRTLPGVQEVTIGDSESIPLDQSQWDLNVVAEGQFLMIREGQELQSEQPAVARSRVTPDYFRLLRIPLLRGRLFNDADTDAAPQVAVINQAMARTYWPNDDPLGKRFKSNRSNAPWITVVGIIANARTQSLAQEEAPQIYLNLYQSGAKHLAILLRGHLDTLAIPEQVREQVQAVDSTLPVFGAAMLNKNVAASLSDRRFSMEMVGLFALTALLLAGLGIYGVISYFVNERTHEIGIRLALGAQRGDILRMVVRQGLGLAIAGAAVGLICALIVSHLIAGLLYGVRPTDPLTFAGVALLLIGVALLACYIPARRAIHVDPLVALRHE